MGKRVKGVYDSDPLKNPDAVFFPELSYMEAIEREVKVMDGTALTLCKDHKIPLFVFNLLEDGNIKRLVLGEKVGTIVH